VSHANKELQEATNCILTTLEKELPAIRASVEVVESGRIQEIIGTSVDAGELYIVRLTAENNGTKIEARSVLRWSKFSKSELEEALSSCAKK
jgi:hypothetical protein